MQSHPSILKNSLSKIIANYESIIDPSRSKVTCLLTNASFASSDFMLSIHHSHTHAADAVWFLD